MRNKLRIEKLEEKLNIDKFEGPLKDLLIALDAAYPALPGDSRDPLRRHMDIIAKNVKGFDVTNN